MINWQQVLNARRALESGYRLDIRDRKASTNGGLASGASSDASTHVSSGQLDALSSMSQKSAGPDGMPAALCPECGCVALPGDRFCQECGARISARGVKRGLAKGKQTSGAMGPAQIICINCGTSNDLAQTAAEGSKCKDCQLSLMPPQMSASGQQEGMLGLRGSQASSIYIQNRKPIVSPPVVSPVNPEPERATLQRDQSAETREQGVAQPEPQTVAQPEPQTVVHPEPQAAAQTLSRTSGQSAAQSKGSAPVEQPVSFHIASSPPSSVSIQLPTELSENCQIFSHAGPLGKPGSMRRHRERSALEFLFPGERHRAAIIASFDKLIADTRHASHAFSLSALVVRFESLIEQIPIPVLLLVGGFLIILGTVSATSYWTRIEQRMRALDKIAVNAEEDMRAYRLDKAVYCLRELEKTEHGDLPPHARAVLNQSLWLRSYSYAKQHKYAKAVADLADVTAEFASYEDARDKLEKYRKLLASHPELGDPDTAQAGNKSAKSSTQSSRKPSSITSTDSIASTEQAASRDARKPAMRRGSAANDQGTPTEIVNNKEEGSQPNPRESAEQKAPARSTSRDGINNVSRDALNNASKGALNNTSKGAQNKISKDARDGMPKSTINNTSRSTSRKTLEATNDDMKRYSGLLLDYFSKADSTRAQGKPVKEPPSYEEWIQSGKAAF